MKRTGWAESECMGEGAAGYGVALRNPSLVPRAPDIPLSGKMSDLSGSPVPAKRPVLARLGIAWHGMVCSAPFSISFLIFSVRGYGYGYDARVHLVCLCAVCLSHLRFAFAQSILYTKRMVNNII